MTGTNLVLRDTGTLFERRMDDRFAVGSKVQAHAIHVATSRAKMASTDGLDVLGSSEQ